MRKIIFLLIIFLASFFVDQEIYFAIEKVRFKPINLIITWSTTLGMLLIVGLLVFHILKQRQKKSLMLMGLSIATAIQTSFLLKIILKIPRPYQTGVIEPLAFSSGYSFPSMHAAFVFSTLPVVAKIYPRFKWLWLVFVSFIAFTRIYLGVHTLIDITGGALIGYTIARLFADFDDRYGFIENFFKQVNNKFELRRQLAHALIGINIILIRKLGFLPNEFLALILVAGLILSMLSKKYDLPIIHKLLDYFERDKARRKFPGQGSFFLILGSFLAFILFPENIALGAIAVMAIGDSVTNLVGGYFGKIKNPLNPKKNIEGTVAAIILSTLAAWYFVPLKIAFVGSLIAMLIESVDLKLGRLEIDDNILIPLIFGEVAVVVSSW